VNAKTYEDGVLEGRVNAHEAMLTDHKGRLDNHADRLRIMERVLYIVIGAMALVEFAPKLQQFLGS
jgi:hypothetical protein